MTLSSTYNHYHLSEISHYNKIFDEINLMPHKKVIIYLYGQVGAGKTTFVKSYLSYLDNNSEVSSPTFSLVNEYMINDLKIFHYDLYRINSIKELYEIGVDYYFEQAGLHFIEWPDRFASELPASDFDICFLSLESSRLVKIHSKT